MPILTPTVLLCVAALGAAGPGFPFFEPITPCACSATSNR